MEEGRHHRLAQVGLSREVTHGVVDEHGIEDAGQPHGAHVALHVLTFRVEALAQGEHLWGQVYQRWLDIPLVVGGHVSAAGAELQQRARWSTGRFGEEPLEERRLLDVLGGRGEQVEPVGKLCVEPRQLVAHPAPLLVGFGNGVLRAW